MRSAFAAAVLLSFALGACTRGGDAHATLPTHVLVDARDRPSLFLNAAADSAQVGYVSRDAVLTVRGAAQQGRVPVRIDGPLEVEGWVPGDQVELIVQHRGRVRGTPAYVAPNQRLRVLGADTQPTRLHVEVTVDSVGRFEGSFPREGLGANAAPTDARAADAGARYRVPAQTAVPLFDLPAHAAAQSRQVAELSPQPAAYEVEVVRAVDGWLAVRAGAGPWLIGWTNVALEAVGDALQTPTVAPSPTHGDALPARLANERGDLRVVAAGTEVRFGDEVVARFKSAGWARVQTFYPSGFADVFAAANDDVAVRGVVPTSALSETARSAAAR